MTYTPGFIACSSDDDDENGGNKTSFVGKWESAYLDDLSLPHHRDEFGRYIVDEDSLDLNDNTVEDVYRYYTFNNDGTGHYVDHGYKTDFDWEILDGTLYTYYQSGYSTRYRIIKASRNVIYVYSSSRGYLKLVRM